MRYFIYKNEEGTPVRRKTVPDYVFCQDAEEVTEEEYRACDIAKEKQIAALKKNLRDTDYIACKIAEGEATAEEYAEIIEMRRGWRADINRLMGEEEGGNEE